eukprot:scaffold5787_cov157-Amphora_coffeaeformis.AAC.16
MILFSLFFVRKARKLSDVSQEEEASFPLRSHPLSPPISIFCFSCFNFVPRQTTLDRGRPFLQGQPCLMITGIIDGNVPGAGGQPKAIEFYANCDIPNLSTYRVKLAFNGNSPGNTFCFPPIVATAGNFIYAHLT